MEKKTVALFGATGMVGAELLKRLVAEGHAVNALVRYPANARELPQSVTVYQGDVLDFHDVDKCIENTQTVYVCIGTHGNKTTQVYSMGTEHIVMAMERHGVRRIICLSSAGVFGSDGGFFGRVIVPLTLWRPFRDKRKQAQLLIKSDLDWTLVRPVEIRPGKKKGRLLVSYDKMMNSSVSLSSLIDFLVHEQTNGDNIRRMPIVAD